MSDKIKVLWIASLFVTAVTFGWLGVRGQKKWDAAWFAAHPVVKEVPLEEHVARGLIFSGDCRIIPGTEGKDSSIFFRGNDWRVGEGPCLIGAIGNNLPAPPKKAKPAKASNRQPSAWTIPIPDPQGSVYTPGLAPDAAKCTEVGGTWHRWYRNTNGEYSYEGQGYCEPAAKP